MTLLSLVIEEKILEAIRKGELDNLPGAGKPLDLEDDAFVPAHLRMAYRLLKNSGYVPREVEQFKRMAQLKEKLTKDQNLSEEERKSLVKELRLLEAEIGTRLETQSRSPSGGG